MFYLSIRANLRIHGSLSNTFTDTLIDRAHFRHRGVPISYNVAEITRGTSNLQTIIVYRHIVLFGTLIVKQIDLFDCQINDW